MIITNFTTVQNNLKEFCDKASDDDEVVIVTRKASKSIVIMSLDNLNEIKRELHNTQYIAKLEKSFAQIEAGNISINELIKNHYETKI